MLRLLPQDDPSARDPLRFLVCLRHAIAHDMVIPDEDREAFMTSVQAEFQRFQEDLIRQGERKGRWEGERQGKREGKAEAIIAFLAARGIVVSEEARQRILSCTEPETLDRWVIRAATAATAEDVVAES